MEFESLMQLTQETSKRRNPAIANELRRTAEVGAVVAASLEAPRRSRDLNQSYELAENFSIEKKVRRLKRVVPTQAADTEIRHSPIRVKPYVNLTGPGDYNTNTSSFGQQKFYAWRRNSPSFSFASGRDYSRG